MHLLSREERGRGFVKGSISVNRVARKDWNERPFLRGLYGLRDSYLYGGTAEDVGSGPRRRPGHTLHLQI
jgi:hypothetical protein